MFQVNQAEDSHEKNQALFSSKDKSKKLKCRLLQFLFGALSIKDCLNATFSTIAIGNLNRNGYRVRKDLFNLSLCNENNDMTKMLMKKF